MSRGRKHESRPEARVKHDLDRGAYLGDLSPVTSEDEVEQTLDRRTFVIPHRAAVIDGEKCDGLDPADPDERSLLIQGEHPEFQEYLADSSWNGEIDGMNPRFHLTMHEVIANQLWGRRAAHAGPRRTVRRRRLPCSAGRSLVFGAREGSG